MSYGLLWPSLLWGFRLRHALASGSWPPAVHGRRTADLSPYDAVVGEFPRVRLKPLRSSPPRKGPAHQLQFPTVLPGLRSQFLGGRSFALYPRAVSLRYPQCEIGVEGIWSVLSPTHFVNSPAMKESCLRRLNVLLPTRLHSYMGNKPQVSTTVRGTFCWIFLMKRMPLKAQKVVQAVGAGTCPRPRHRRTCRLLIKTPFLL